MPEVQTVSTEEEVAAQTALIAAQRATNQLLIDEIEAQRLANEAAMLPPDPPPEP
jgi:hypothetical protein